ncbi:MAG: hypothetical protein E7354_03320 [Clostridiales bacterium]|nr:hypothetical protein [Clostridiales bacterium]
MLGKLLKNDLKKNMKWMWILFVGTIVVAGITRGCKELGENIAFFKIMGIFFDSVFYALLVNTILHPFLRNFLNFSKSLYGDESYLTHTLPVTKNQIFNSKVLTAIIEIVLGFVSVVLSIAIMFGSPAFVPTVKMLLSMLVVGQVSVFWSLTLFVVLVIVEFLMYMSIIFFAITLAYKEKEKRVLRTFVITAVLAFAAITVLGVAMIAVLLISGVDISSSTLILSSSAFVSVLITGIVMYIGVCVACYFLAKRELNKGVNVD